MGSQFVRSGAVMRVFSVVFFAFLALGQAAGEATPAAAQETYSALIEVVREEPSGTYGPAANETFTLVITREEDLDPRTITIVTDPNGMAYTEPLPVGEYYVIEGASADGLSTLMGVTMDGDPVPLDSYLISFQVPPSDGILGLMAVPIEAEPVGDTPVGTNIEVQSPDTGTTITFANVTQPGTTTVTVTTEAPALPSGFSLDGAIFYEVETTAVFDEATICFLYAGDSSQVELLHFNEATGVWETVTSDWGDGYICGWVTSFSPFAIVAQEQVAATMTGFHAPVAMTPGVFNTVKGGSTVPLKFNVYQGTELTDPAAVWVSIASMGCPGGSVDPVDGVTLTGSGTALRYAGTPGIDGQFIQNWKTPKVTAATCYQITAGTTDGSAAVTTLFQLNP